MADTENPVSRRQALALAAALALTVVTAGAAVTGLRHQPAHPAAAPVVHLVQPPAPAPAPTQVEESE
jgi:alpha-D-ribose 1-methylphosphonate 5-phosphate C-P lyase